MPNHLHTPPPEHAKDRKRQALNPIKRGQDEPYPEDSGEATFQPGSSSQAPPQLPLTQEDSDSDHSDDSNQDSQAAVPYQDDDALYIDEHPTIWQQLEESQRVCANTASFTVPTLADCPIDVKTVSSSTTCSPDAAYVATARSAGAKKKQLKARKEASITDLRQYGKQFTEAKKAEYESRKQNQVFELVDMRKVPQ